MKLLHSGLFVRDLPSVSSVDPRWQYQLYINSERLAAGSQPLNTDATYPETITFL
jgi:hypothetical protein